VGKTYAMLVRRAIQPRDERRHRRLETHGRAETAALLADLRSSAEPMCIGARDLGEFDLDAALLRQSFFDPGRRTAHSNVQAGRGIQALQMSKSCGRDIILH